jgi:6-phosphogluconolactonase
VAVQVNLLEFADRVSASGAAAELMAKSIRSCLDRQDRCSIVVSGGSTPGPCFDSLSQMPLEWPRVTVIPSDERWVPADHPDSNERLIRERLLVNKAASGQVLPLFRKDVEPPAAVSLIEQDLAELATPVSCALLGMGEDGHFASLFPDLDGLKQALEPNSGEPCLVVKTASSPHLRISLSLAFLLESEAIVLLIFGAAKRRVFDAAATGNTAYPIESLIWRGDGRLTVLWAP